MPRQGFEIALAGRELEDAAGQLVVADCGALSQVAQAIAAVRRQRGKRTRVTLEAARQAFEQEAHAPFPLRPVRARAKQQRRILAPEPAQDLRNGRRLRPGFGMAGGNLPAVRERGLESGAIASFDDRDLVTRLGKVPRARHAHHTGTEDDDFHCIMIAAWPSSPSANGALSCAASIITSRPTPPSSARWSSRRR